MKPEFGHVDSKQMNHLKDFRLDTRRGVAPDRQICDDALATLIVDDGFELLVECVPTGAGGAGKNLREETRRVNVQRNISVIDIVIIVIIIDNVVMRNR